jgi:hypothetical protein
VHGEASRCKLYAVTKLSRKQIVTEHGLPFAHPLRGV